MKAIVTLLATIIAIALLWRLASRRRSLPCPVWLRWLVEIENPFTITSRSAEIISHLGLAPGMRVLDLGCGPGRVTIPLAKAVGPQGEVVAMDIQAGMLQRVRQRVETEKLNNVRFVLAGAGNGALESEYYDRVVLVTVLGEIPDRERALTEIAGALNASGLLSVTEIIFDPHFQSHSALQKMAAKAGLHEMAFYGNKIAYTAQFKKID